MFVSSYHEAFRNAFAEVATEDAADRFEADLKKIADQVCERVVDRIGDDIRDRFLASMSDAICGKAAEVATHMLEAALSGDDAEIKNLFGFYTRSEGDLKHLALFGYKPTRWTLIEALMERRPDVFNDERIHHLNETVLALRDENKRLHKRAHWWQAKAEGRDTQGFPE